MLYACDVYNPTHMNGVGRGEWGEAQYITHILAYKHAVYTLRQT